MLRASRPALEPASSGGPRTVLVDVGDGDVLRVDRWSASSAARVAVDVAGSAVIGQRFRGRGAGVIEVDPPAGGTGSGRELVSVRSGSSSVPWRALRRITRTDWTSSVVVVARGLGAGAPPFAFDGGAATRVAVDAPHDVPWTLVVAIAPGRDPGRDPA